MIKTLSLTVFAAAFILSGCAQITDRSEAPSQARSGEGQLRPKARPGTSADGDAAAGETADAAEAPVPDASGSLGVTVASLGDPSQGGLWLKTPLVRSERMGRLSYGGTTIEARLIPIPGEVGSGSRMSLAAFQALGAPLTDLPEITVFGG